MRGDAGGDAGGDAAARAAARAVCVVGRHGREQGPGAAALASPWLSGERAVRGSAAAAGRGLLPSRERGRCSGCRFSSGPRGPGATLTGGSAGGRRSAAAFPAPRSSAAL